MTDQTLPGQYKVTAETHINAPASEVWDLLKEFGDVSEWAPGVTKSYHLNAKRSGVGTARHCDIKGFGSIQEYVTEWQEGVGFTYSVTPLGPLTESHSRWTISAIDGQNSKLRVTLSYDIRFGLFGKLLHKLVMRKKLERALPETVDSVRDHVKSERHSDIGLAATA